MAQGRFLRGIFVRFCDATFVHTEDFLKRCLAQRATYTGIDSRGGVSFLPTCSSLNHIVFSPPASLSASPAKGMDLSPERILKPTRETF